MFDESILVINTGSSSLKFGLYAKHEGDEQLLFSGLADGIGRNDGQIELKDSKGHLLRSEKRNFATESDAFECAVHWLKKISPEKPGAVGHRIVHGGPRFITHQKITSKIVEELRACLHFAPLHMPIALALIDQAERDFPGVPQFACFDTAFHSTLPEVAARFPLPEMLFDEGVRRYGFHGLSYESIVYQLGTYLPSRTIIAHLGSGASLVAVKDWQSIDTTMGLTPTGGIPMATRSGDLDPGVLLYLLRTKKMNIDSLERLLNHDSGMFALSGGIGDMRELEAAEVAGNPEAALAIEAFCQSIRKTIAAYSAVLGGLDMLVFTGGIGEHSARLRKRICDGLDLLGLSIDDALNESHENQISTQQSKVSIRVLPSREDQQIARHCRTML